MHRALRVSEVLRIICEGSEKSSLLAVARTCHTFCPVALDVLWAELDNVLPLLKCLPPEFCAEEEGSLHWGDGVYLTEANRINFLKYSHRVRSLSWVFYSPEKLEASGLNIDPKVLQMFSVLDCTKSPFPYLKSFYWSDDREENIPFINLFIGPSLLDLRLRFDNKPGPLRFLFLSTLSWRCPQLKSLRESKTRDEDEATTAVFSQALCGFRHLERLHCHQLEENAWDHILQLPSLVDLDVDVASFSLSKFLPTSKVCRGALSPNIRSIRLVCLDHEAAAKLLGCMHIAPHKFDIWIRLTSAGERPALFDALSQHCDHRSLQHITILNLQISSDPTFFISIRTVQPFFCFTALRTLVFSGSLSSSLNDHALSEMANSWPLLEKLHLGYWQTPSKITFQGLASLVDRCPRLHDLQIGIDARELASFGLQDLRRITPNHTIRQLDLGNSRLDNPTEVALRLFDLFPGLERIVASKEGFIGEPGFEQCWELWRQVGGHLRAFRMMREQIRWRDQQAT
ncbi:hypothetical protein BV22DRAFT_1130001 [Leucogyrophana mollusca]|uniref:Uncharacterized protein n=1 Tax=Leucogyrophana mollusca TaxID=85980 RepID=A0ACB8BHF3_9AGAM|nr:hypothetical protein BV22DRAFT_1130001 [Leucogyrophana mollusca]